MVYTANVYIQTTVYNSSEIFKVAKIKKATREKQISIYFTPKIGTF